MYDRFVMRFSGRVRQTFNAAVANPKVWSLFNPPPRPERICGVLHSYHTPYPCLLMIVFPAGAQDKDGAVVIYTEARVGERAKERVAEERDLRRHPREVSDIFTAVQHAVEPQPGATASV